MMKRKHKGNGYKKWKRKLKKAVRGTIK